MLCCFVLFPIQAARIATANQEISAIDNTFAGRNKTLHEQDATVLQKCAEVSTSAPSCAECRMPIAQMNAQHACTNGRYSNAPNAPNAQRSVQLDKCIPEMTPIAKAKTKTKCTLPFQHPLSMSTLQYQPYPHLCHCHLLAILPTLAIATATY